MLIPLLMGVGMETVAGMNWIHSPTVYADKNKRKKPASDRNKNDDNKNDDSDSGSDDDSDSDSESSSSSEASSDTTNQWNAALQTLASDAMSDAYSSGSDSSSSSSDGSSDDEPADIMKYVSGGNLSVGSVWGFMGPTNTDISNGSSKAGAKVSYDGLVAMGSGGSASANNTAARQIGDGYKQAARLAYVYQMSGLDHSNSNGVNGSGKSGLQTVIAVIERVSYIFSRNINNIFDFVTSALQKCDPIQWALHGTEGGYFNKVAELIHRLYQVVSGLGVAVFGVTIILTIGLAMLGFRFGTDMQTSRGGALVSGLVNLLSRAILYVAVPIMALSLYSAVLNNIQGKFSSGEYNTSAYAVYGSLLDNQRWVNNTRMAVPNNLSTPLTASFNDNNLPTFSHDDIIKMNAFAGNQQASQLNAGQSNATAYFNNMNHPDNASVTHGAELLLNKWQNNSTYDAASYAAGVMPYLNQTLLDEQDSKSADNGGGQKNDKKAGGDDKSSGGEASNISDLLTQDKYSRNGTTVANDDDNSATFSSNVGGGKSDNAGLDPKNPGGFSTIGQYGYLLTIIEPTQMIITDTSNLNNDITSPQHSSVSLVGSGIQSYGNLIWAFGLMVGLSLLGLGFLYVLCRALIVAIPATIGGITLSALRSFRGYAQLASAVAAMAVSVLGTMFLYQFFCELYIAIAQIGDVYLGKSINMTLTGFGLHGPVATLAASVNGSTMYGAFSILYGIAMLLLPIAFLKWNQSILGLVTSYLGDGINAITRLLSHTSVTETMQSNVASMTNASAITNAPSRMAGMVGSAGRAMGGAGGLATGAAAGYFGAKGAEKLASALNSERSNSDKSQSAQNSTNPNGVAVQAGSNDKQGRAAQQMAAANAMMAANSTNPMGAQAAGQQAGQLTANNAADSIMKGQDTMANAQGAPGANPSPALTEAAHGGTSTSPTPLANSQMQAVNQGASIGNANAANALARDQIGAGRKVDANGRPVGKSNVKSGLSGEADMQLGDDPMSAQGEVEGANAVPMTDVTPDQIEDQMPAVRDANNQAEQAEALAAANPTNETLANRADELSANADAAAGQALDDFNAQPAIQAIPNDVLDKDHANDLSVGTVANNLDALQTAQSSYQEALDQYGADAKPTQEAHNTLQRLQTNAIDAGLSRDVVTDAQKVSHAHDVISGMQKAVRAGSWTSDMQGSAGHMSLGNDVDTIGI